LDHPIKMTVSNDHADELGVHEVGPGQNLFGGFFLLDHRLAFPRCVDHCGTASRMENQVRTARGKSLPNDRNVSGFRHDETEVRIQDTQGQKPNMHAKQRRARPVVAAITTTKPQAARRVCMHVRLSGLEYPGSELPFSIVTKPDNVPIVGMLFLVPFFTLVLHARSRPQ